MLSKVRVLTFVLLLDCIVVSQSGVLSNNDVIAMTRAGISPEIIITKIKSDACSFDTTSGTIIQLKQSGVSDEVILAMVSRNCRPEGNPAKSTALNRRLKTVDEVDAEIRSHYDSRFFSVNYDRYKDRTFLRVEIDLNAPRQSLFSSSASFTWRLISVFEGNGVFERPAILYLCSSSTSETWRFLKSRNLIILVGDRRLSLGEGTHDGDVRSDYRGVTVAESLCWSLDLGELESLTNAPKIDFQLGTYESTILASKMERLRAFWTFFSKPLEKNNPSSNAVGSLDLTHGKRSVYLEVSDPTVREAVEKRLLARKFSVADDAKAAELVIQIGVEKVDQRVTFGRSVKVPTAQIFVYVLLEGTRSLVYKKINKVPTFGWAMTNQAKSLLEDFLEEQKKIER